MASIRVLVSDSPSRTLALATDLHVLLFKHVQTASNQGLPKTPTSFTASSTQRKVEPPRCIVEFLPKAAIDLKGYRTLTIAKGTLGLITLGEDVFVCVATGSRETATVRPNETVMQIFAVEFYCLNRADYDHANAYGAGYRDGYREPNPYSNTLFEDEQNLDNPDSPSEHPFMALKKLLSGGSFYYSCNFDLTRRLQDRADVDSTIDVSSLDEGLLWNSYMIDPLLSFRSRLSDEEKQALDHSSLLTSVIRGYVGTMTVAQNANPLKSTKTTASANLTVISRLSARRAGTRFNSRGIDDNGNVANFVETETVFWSPSGLCFSYVQVRGSIPIFWESSSTLIPGQQKIQITRSPEATQLSFDRHFEAMTTTYGRVHVVNLLSETKPGEVELTEKYNMHIARSSLTRRDTRAIIEEKPDYTKEVLLQKTEFDFHEQSRAAGGYDGAKKIRPLVAESTERFLYFLTQDIEDEVEAVELGRPVIKKVHRPAMVVQQNGVFRTNCLDCLDRTNLIQGIISQTALELFLEHRGEVAGNSNLSVFWMRHSTLWADNGDALSKIYAGTGALKSSFTRHGKMSFGGLMADARKSATRLYVNHFEDKGRQNTTDLLLGRLVGQEPVELFDPISEWVHDRLRQKAEEFESSETVRVWVGTYNLNGQRMSDASQLRKWLNVRSGEGYDIVVVGFQEIVELSPQQIMNTDPARRMEWEQAVKSSINDEYISEKKEDQYILLRTGQLVGAALIVFVKVSMLSKIKNVEGAIKKTGVSGLAGNKGAVAVRMEVDGSSLCFVTAHLAAGFGNYDERNRDYSTIINGLRFQRDRKIEDHEVVIWLGDFNYRIGTKPEDARELIEAYKGAGGQGPRAKEALHDLYKHDQLNIQMVAGQTFPFYQEGEIKFLPTYKFDLGNDNYDTSEKARIPAWTDRILWKVDTTKGTNIRQSEYMSVMDLRFSDHRPVFSTFSVTVRVIDDVKRIALLKKLYEKRARQLREDIDDEEDSDDEIAELTGYKSIAPGFPPASSDKRKWWMDGDKPVASKLQPLREGLVLNPDRNGNPWREDGEDDWVTVEVKREKMASKAPEPPAPRKARIPSRATPSAPESTGSATAEASTEVSRSGTPLLQSLSDMEERQTRTSPPKPPPSRGSIPLQASTPPRSTLGTRTPSVPRPLSRTASITSTLPGRPSPPPPAPRQSSRALSTISTTTSLLDFDPSNPSTLDSFKPILSRTASHSSTTSSNGRAPPQRPNKPSGLSAPATLAPSVTGTSIVSSFSNTDGPVPSDPILRSLSPRPEISPSSTPPVTTSDQDLRRQLTYTSPSHPLIPSTSTSNSNSNSNSNPHSHLHPPPPLKPKRLSISSTKPDTQLNPSLPNPNPNPNPNPHTYESNSDIPPPLPKRTGTVTSLSSTTSSFTSRQVGPPLPPRRGIMGSAVDRAGDGHGHGDSSAAAWGGNGGGGGGGPGGGGAGAAVTPVDDGDGDGDGDCGTDGWERVLRQRGAER